MAHTKLFSHWHKSKVWELINYKKAWKENGIKPQFRIKTNGASKKKGDTCFSFTITFGYLLFNYINYNLQGRKWDKE